MATDRAVRGGGSVASPTAPFTLHVRVKQDGRRVDCTRVAWGQRVKIVFEVRFEGARAA